VYLHKYITGIIKLYGDYGKKGN